MIDQESVMLVSKPEGNYRFFPSTGGSPFCNGNIADPGYEIVYATFERPLRWRAGFDRVAEHLAALGRPRQALCGLELRCTAPYTQEGFLEFNAGYGEVLRAWGLNEGGVGTGSTTRTNIAPGYQAPGEEVMTAFSYTVPSTSDRPTFVVSGTPAGPVRRGEATAEANREQVARMTTDVVVYAPRNLEPVLRTELFPRIGSAVLNGIRWSPGSAPVGGGGIELGTYGTRQKLSVAVS
jgi:hypothetical protein